MQLSLEQPKTSQRTTALAFCGLAGALIFGLLPISHWLVSGDSIAEMLACEVIWWCFALVILLWLTSAERLPISSIGFRSPTWRTVAFAVLAAIAVTAIMVLQFAVIIPMFHLDASAAIAGGAQDEAQLI